MSISVSHSFPTLIALLDMYSVVTDMFASAFSQRPIVKNSAAHICFVKIWSIYQNNLQPQFLKISPPGFEINLDQ